MSEKHCPELLAGYALGALEPAEEQQAAAHVADCVDCRDEAISLAAALHATLGHDCPSAEPSPLVRTQFLARLALEITPANAAARTPVDPAPPRPPMIMLEPRPPQPPAVIRQPFVPRWVIPAATIPTVLAVMLAFGLLNMKQQYDDQHNHLLGQALAAPHVAMVLNGPAVRHGMTGEVIMPTSGSGGLLILSGLTKAPANMEYTCWVQKDGHWTAWGPIKPDASRIAMFVMDKSMDPHNAATLAVTLEHMNRPPSAPSEPMLLSTTL
jgi:hypothetical protein